MRGSGLALPPRRRRGRWPCVWSSAVCVGVEVQCCWEVLEERAEAERGMSLESGGYVLSCQLRGHEDDVRLLPLETPDSDCRFSLLAPIYCLRGRFFWIFFMF